MAGVYVPLVLIPRFTSYLGAAVYTSVALDVSEYEKFVATVWRGPLIGDTGTGAALSLAFEYSEDGEQWRASGITLIVTPDASTVVSADLTSRWLRVKLTLTEDDDDVVAMTCWAMGHLERRERE